MTQDRRSLLPIQSGVPLQNTQVVRLTCRSQSRNPHSRVVGNLAGMSGPGLFHGYLYCYDSVINYCVVILDEIFNEKIQAHYFILVYFLSHFTTCVPECHIYRRIWPNQFHCFHQFGVLSLHVAILWFKLWPPNLPYIFINWSCKSRVKWKSKVKLIMTTSYLSECTMIANI